MIPIEETNTTLYPHLAFIPKGVVANFISHVVIILLLSLISSMVRTPDTNKQFGFVSGMKFPLQLQEPKLG